MKTLAAVILLLGCSPSDPPAGAADSSVTDSAIIPDATAETRRDVQSIPESVIDPPWCDNTTGRGCTVDDECDVSGSGINLCTKGAFADGSSLFPTPVCIGNSCDPVGATGIAPCDCNRGLCLPTSSAGICLPMCTFKDRSDPPLGCAGMNACVAAGWGRDAATLDINGVGYCLGGCRVDTDCPAPDVCQPETGFCVKTKVVYPKSIGTACTDADAKTPAQCNCIFEPTGKGGYCTSFCRYGDTCAAGFSCDPGLPKTKLREDEVVFASVPLGLAGHCLKNCTSDADCDGLHAYCAENAGMAGQKTCQIGERRCFMESHCPSGQTCVGATATELGFCK